MHFRYMSNKLSEAGNYVLQRKEQIIKYTCKGAKAGLCVGLLSNTVYSIGKGLIEWNVKSINAAYCKTKVYPTIDNFIGPISITAKTDVATTILKVVILPIVALSCGVSVGVFEILDLNVQYVGSMTLAGATLGFAQSLLKQEVKFQEEVDDQKQNKSIEQRLNDIGFDTNEIPERFLCPITHEVMNEPSFIPDGYTYERKAILESYSRRKVSPMTNNPLLSFSLYTNQVMKSEISQLVEKAERDYWSFVGTLFKTKTVEDVEPEKMVSIIKAYTL
jgi:hypothetical protein